MPFLLRSPLLAAGAGLAVAASTLVTGPPAAAAAPPYAVTHKPVAAAAGWLATQFVDRSHLPHPDGTHFDDQYGSSFYPDYGLNADVIFGLAAAKLASGRIARALGYLRQHVADYTQIGRRGGPFDGAIGKLALAAIVAGAHPEHFGGYHLLSRLHKDECTSASPNGSEPCPASGAGRNTFSSESESFVLLAESRGAPAFRPTQAATRYFLSLQCASGGFTDGVAACGDAAAKIDATSYAIMALTAIGRHPVRLHRAVQWLLSQRRPGGYWVVGRPSSVSTGLAVAALEGRGLDLSRSRQWLRSQQVSAGHRGAGALRYQGKFAPTSTSGTSLSVRATAQALTGLVPGGALETVTASGSHRAITLFRPTASMSARRIAVGHRETVVGRGFVAGEHVRAALKNRPGHRLGTAVAGPGGLVSISFRPTRALVGLRLVQLSGHASGLRVTRPIRVVRSF